VSTLDHFARDFDRLDLDPTEAGEYYQPEETYRMSTRPFRSRTIPARTRAEREWTFFIGFVYGMALSLPLWFVLVIVALWWGGR
jgi:hypothetical protein